MRIRNNLASLNTLRHTTRSQQGVQDSIERLSSGRVLNRGSDAPAVLVGAETLKNRKLGLAQATKNIEAQVNLVQSAESGLGEVAKLAVGVHARRGASVVSAGPPRDYTGLDRSRPVSRADRAVFPSGVVAELTDEQDPGGRAPILAAREPRAELRCGGVHEGVALGGRAQPGFDDGLGVEVVGREQLVGRDAVVLGEIDPRQRGAAVLPVVGERARIRLVDRVEPGRASPTQTLLRRGGWAREDGQTGNRLEDGE